MSRMSSNLMEISKCMTKLAARFSRRTSTISRTKTAFTCPKVKILTTSLYSWSTRRSNKLGEGGFGHVYLLRNKLNGEEIAAKFVDHECLSRANTIEKALKEARHLTNLKHKNIINLQTVFIYKREIIMFTEYIAGGELKEYLFKKSKPFAEFEAKKIMQVL